VLQELSLTLCASASFVLIFFVQFKIFPIFLKPPLWRADYEKPMGTGQSKAKCS
jgi:hypothetical protein